MRQVFLLLPLVAVGLTLGSCSLLPGGGGDEPTPETPQTTAPTPAPEPDAELFAPPTTETLSSVLIPSTDPDARRRATTEGRPDPFADLSLAPQVTLAPPPAPTPAGTAPGAVAIAPPPPVSGTQPGTSGTANGAGIPGQAPPPPLDFTPVLPALPEPTAARNTKVTGVVQIGGIDYVMVESPDERFSRYVKVGDYVANGQVLVKAIAFNRGVPVVTLEQYGIPVPVKLNETSVASNPGERTVPTLEES
ncbi:hypothetical protein FEK30_12200 [Picosynechococcus sp. PCC 11901]|uniref:hypothetical protein n=1 Tax=Picosynechococcus sp. PCC 11901 TaxID=2579791 RepID=UPI0010FBFCAA|nr:hypothetical protein [Picosynechococcus sp. PCC 11901]QCS50128.1 hypothetical protein FEK30_12200 [Picosynechococcus sp. PCC 11901]